MQTLHAGFALPLLSQLPDVFRASGKAYLNFPKLGNERLEIDISNLNRLGFFSDQLLTGKLDVGVTSTPEKGSGILFILKQGQYEHLELGTKLEDLAFKIMVTAEHITLHSLSARTPGKGVLHAEGQMNFTKSYQLAGDILITFDQARLLHLDTIEASVSGKVEVKKILDSPFSISGNLNLEESTFHMDRLPQPSPRVLEYTLKGTDASQRVEPGKKQRYPLDSRLKFTGSILMQIPGRFIVQGKNIYSTWEGALNISFKPEGVFLDGTLNPRRGTVGFFGEDFELTSGAVLFNNLIKTAPILDLKAEYSQSDLDTFLQITGQADNPEFALSSSPPMPRDENISHILFGENLSSITGLQALEVGLAVKSMMDSEGDSNWDLMGKARDFLGVDRLAIRESAEDQGSTEVVAGRQLNDYFYLEVSQNIKEPNSSFILEYEVRKNLSITTETGTHTLPGIGVNWKRDY